MPNGDAILRGRWAAASFGIIRFLISFLRLLIGAGSPTEETGLLHRVATETDGTRVATNAARNGLSLRADTTTVAWSGIVGTRRGSSQMWDIVRVRMLGTDICDTNIRCLASLAECVVSGIEIFTFLQWSVRKKGNRGVREMREQREETHLEFVLEKILFSGHLSVKTQQALLVRGQGLPRETSVPSI